jgi:hypothetical protein
MKQKIRLKVQLINGIGDCYKKEKIIRTIDFSEGTFLPDVVENILESFDFVCDHAFGIYDDLNRPKEGYSIFSDMKGLGDPMGGKSIKKAKIDTVFNEKKKIMYMIFDFGDEWIFKISCVDILLCEENEQYPLLVSKQGEAPQQYPDYDDEENEEGESQKLLNV